MRKFEKIALDWWSPEGPTKILQAINPLRTAYVKDVVTEGLQIDSFQQWKSLSIVDVGCGGGLFTEVCSVETYFDYSSISCTQTVVSG